MRVLAALLAALAASGSPALVAPALSLPAVRAAGSGVVLVAPDVARIAATFSSFSPISSATPSVSAEAGLMGTTRAFLGGLEALGVASVNVSQAGFHVVETYIWNASTMRSDKTGFTASASFSVALGDLDLVANVSSLATSLGGTVDGASFGVSDAAERAASLAALSLAATDATARARALAAGVGAALGAAMYVDDASSPQQTMQAPLYRAAAVAEGDASGFASAGLVRVEASVNVAYELVPAAAPAAAPTARPATRAQR